MGDIFNEALQRDWSQSVKPSSKEVQARKGCQDLEPHDESWDVVRSMVVLGQVVQNKGAVNEDYDERVRKMWRSFFANAGMVGNNRLSVGHHKQLLVRATQPLVDGHAVRWPYTRHRARKLDALQIRMLRGFISMRLAPSED